MNNSETKFTITTMVAVNKFKLTDQSIFKLPDEIQFVKCNFDLNFLFITKRNNCKN